MKKDEINQKSDSNYTNVIKCFLFPCLFIFYQLKLPNIHKKCFVLFSSSNLIVACLLKSQHKKGMGVYKVFSSGDLTLMFYGVYLRFNIGLRRTKNKHNCAYFKLFPISFPNSQKMQIFFPFLANTLIFQCWENPPLKRLPRQISKLHILAQKAQIWNYQKHFNFQSIRKTRIILLPIM